MPSESPGPQDVRMRGFAHRTPVAEVTKWMRDNLETLPGEVIPTTQAAGRVLVQGVTSDVDVPGFARAMMDGYAVRAADTSGASAYNPITLPVVDQSLPGRPAAMSLSPGRTIRIMTGAPIPAGADAVLPAERATVEGASIQVLAEVSPGKHVAQVGEDIRAGSDVLGPGRRLRPQDIGVLVSIGVSQVNVVRPVRVRVVVTGDELLPPGNRPAGSCIVDSNSPMLAALVKRDGGVVSHPGIIPDDPEQIRAAIYDDVDVVLVSGGSSVGQEDHAPRVLAAEGELVFHGIAMRPSSPTGIGRLGNRWVFLLPGNPVSCLCAYDFFAGPTIRVLSGGRWESPYRSGRGRLRRKLTSAIGRVDYARVQWDDGAVVPLAIGGASVLSSTTRADGFVIVAQDSEGFAEGAEVDVYFYDA